MKKLLLASTALVATAGFAAADVALSGSAEMGVKRGHGEDRTELHQDVDVRFKMTGESDNGISFGATIDLDDATEMAPGINNDNAPDYNVFVSAGAATLTMGDTDGAFDKALTEVALAGGSLADDETAHAGYNGNSGLDGDEDAQVARFDYAASGFTFSLSAELDDDGETDAVAVDADPADGVIAPAVAADANENPIYGIGVAYSAELAGLDLGVGLGYQAQEDNASVTGLSLKTTFANGLSAAVNYSVTDFDDDALENETHTAIGFGYSSGPLAIGVNYGTYENAGGVEDQTNSGLGLAATYDLGGGLSAQFGYGSSNIEDADETDSFSLGLAMSF
jgi:outer membrane protein OmpU